MTFTKIMRRKEKRCYTLRKIPNFYNSCINKITKHITAQRKRFEENSKIFEFLNQSVPILMGIFIFFNPFSHTTSIKEICLYLSIFIVILLIFYKKIDFTFKSPLTLPFVLFITWAFIGLFFALHKGNSIHDFYAHLLKYLAIYYILVNFFNSRKRVIVLSWIIIVSATIFSIGGLVYFYIILGYYKVLTARMSFQETSTNIIGFVCIFALLLSIHLLPRINKLYKKILLLISLVTTSSVTLFTLSFGTMLGTFLSLLVLFPKNKRIVFTIFLWSMIFLVILTFSFTFAKERMCTNFIQNKLLNEGRIKIWRTDLEIIKDYPISGIGFGMDEMSKDPDLWNKYTARVPPKYRVRVLAADPHNIFISTALRTGFVGLALFVYIIFAFLRMALITIRYGKDDFIKSWGLCITAAFVAWFVKGMFEPALSHVPAIILYTTFAMMTILWRLNTEEGAGGSQRTVSPII